MFNTTIHGHDGNEPDDNEEFGSDERTGSIKSTPYFSTVEEVTPDDAIKHCLISTSSCTSSL